MMNIASAMICVLFMLTALMVGGIGPFNIVTVAIAAIVSIALTIAARIFVLRTLKIDIFYTGFF